MFEPLDQRQSAVELCTEAIRDSILNRRFKIGERLPPERTLAAMFDLNRITVRGALSRLTADGLLSVRHGSGYRIENFYQTGGAKILGAMIKLANKDSTRTAILEDILTLRRHLARATLEKMASNLDSSHLARIQACIDAFESAVAHNESIRVIARHDLDICDALLQATGSIAYRVCINPIVHLTTQWPALREAMYRDPVAHLAGYRMLRFWLQNPQADGVETLIEQLERRDEGTIRFLERPTPAGR